MAIFENYPYTNLHNLNLDALIKHQKETDTKVDDIIENIGTASEAADEARQYAKLAQEAAQSIIDTPRRVVCIGDSYADGYTPDGNNDGWPLYLKNYMGLSDEDFDTAHMGGTGFAANNNDTTFTTLLYNLTITDRNTVTDVVVAGGRNDASWREVEIQRGINDFCTAAKTLFPIAKIWIGFIGRSAESGSVITNMKRARGAYMQAAKNNNVNYLPGVQNLLLNEWLASDHMHPNANGNKCIAWGIKSCLMGSYASIQKQYSFDSSALIPHEGTITPATSVRIDVDDNVTDVYIVLGSYTPTTPFDLMCNGYNDFEIFAIPIAGNVFAANNEPFGLATSVLVQTSDNKYHMMHGTIKIFENHVQVSLIDVNDAGSNYRSLTGIKYVSLAHTYAHFTIIN